MTTNPEQTAPSAYLQYWTDARDIANSDAVLSIYAAPEFDELNVDGKAWIAAIVAETTRRVRYEPIGVDDRQITSSPVDDSETGFCAIQTGDYGDLLAR